MDPNKFSDGALGSSILPISWTNIRGQQMQQGLEWFIEATDRTEILKEFFGSLIQSISWTDILYNGFNLDLRRITNIVDPTIILHGTPILPILIRFWKEERDHTSSYILAWIFELAVPIIILDRPPEITASVKILDRSSKYFIRSSSWTIFWCYQYYQDLEWNFQTPDLTRNWDRPSRYLIQLIFWTQLQVHWSYKDCWGILNVSDSAKILEWSSRSLLFAVYYWKGVRVQWSYHYLRLIVEITNTNKLVDLSLRSLIQPRCWRGRRDYWSYPHLEKFWYHRNYQNLEGFFDTTGPIKILGGSSRSLIQTWSRRDLWDHDIYQGFGQTLVITDPAKFLERPFIPLIEARS